MSEAEVVWKNLEAFAPAPKKRGSEAQKVLNRVSGKAEPGEMIAIIGPSGAGKTTLLNVISGRISGKYKLGGEIFVNSHKRSSKSWPAISAYVEQYELLYSFMTVRETVDFSAKMRTNLSKEDREKKVDQILSELGLSYVASKKVNKVSGGERKRLTIGEELVTDPCILFLDEPTSNLDSFTAFTTVSLLQKLCKTQRRTVLLTIHQPRFEILELFDKVMLLSLGNVVYFGPVNACLTYLASKGLNVPAHQNPADFFIDMITLDPRSQESYESSKQRVEWLIEEWTKEPECCENTRTEEILAPKKKHNMLFEIYQLLVRNLKESWRDPMLYIFMAIQGIFIIVILGLTFLQLGYSQQSIQSRAGFLFFVIINAFFFTISPLLNVFPTEKKIIRREIASNSYNSSSAFIARYLSAIPVHLIYFFVVSTALYWMVGLQANAGNWIFYILDIFAMALVAIAIGLGAGALAEDARSAQLLGPTLLLFFVIFGGNFANVQTIPGYLAWLIWISPVQYGYKANMQNEFYGLTFQCDTADGVCIKTGEQVIENYDLTTPTKWICFLILLGWALFYCILGLLALWRATRFKFKLL